MFTNRGSYQAYSKSFMIHPSDFTTQLIKNNLGPVVEVPCSFLKDFLGYLWDSKEIPVINPANEAIAMAEAAGEYMGSGRIPVVAIQNSGLMNTLNALTSLHKIYEIPVFMMVTWRGEGGAGKDAPEHDITGENLLKYLETFEIPYKIADGVMYKEQVSSLAKKARETKKPVVLVIRKGIFEPYEKETEEESPLEMTRFDAISIIKRKTNGKVIFLSGTGFPTRDSFNVKDTSDFYTMGSMGHVFGIGLGVARTNPDKKVIILDGDGGAIMHAGAFASLDPQIHKNLIYIMFDNGVYESTGGQSSPSQNVDFKSFAKAFRFGKYLDVNTQVGLEQAVKKVLGANTPSFLHIYVKQGGNVGTRVSDKYTCPQVTERFMENLK